MNKKILKRIVTRLAVIAPVISAVICFTAPDAKAYTLNDWLSGPGITGDWGGVRTQLKDIGFTFKGLYVGEFADAFSGGRDQGSAYAQQFGFGVDVDMGKVANIQGGTVHIAFIQREGHSASTEYTGNKLNFQEEYGLGEDFRMTALNYEQNLLDKALNLKIGYQSMGDDFEATTVACTFQNVGFCGHSQSLPNNSGWADYPSARWGGRIRYFPRPDIYVETGAYDVNPTDSLGPNGTKISFAGSTGALVPIEIGYNPQFGAQALTGHYKLGGYYDTSSAKEMLDIPSTATEEGRYGGYLSFDQMVWSPGMDNSRGLILFIQATISDDRTALMPTYIDGGLVLRGPVASRATDFLNFGFVRAGINHHLINLHRNEIIASGAEYTSLQSGETLFELGYGAKVTPWLLIHPNIQYDVNPGAFSYKHYKNAWAFGFQTSIIF